MNDLELMRKMLDGIARENDIKMPESFVAKFDPTFNDNVSCEQEATNICNTMHKIYRSEIASPKKILGFIPSKAYKKDLQKLAEMLVTLDDKYSAEQNLTSISKEVKKIAGKYKEPNPQNDNVASVIKYIDQTIECTKLIPEYKEELDKTLLRNAVKLLENMKETLQSSVVDGHSQSARNTAQRTINALAYWRRECNTGTASNLSYIKEAQAHIDDWTKLTKIPSKRERAESTCQMDMQDAFSSVLEMKDVDNKVKQFFVVINKKDSAIRDKYEQSQAELSDIDNQIAECEAEIKRAEVGMINGSVDVSIGRAKINEMETKKEMLLKKYDRQDLKVISLESQAIPMREIIDAYSVFEIYYDLVKDTAGVDEFVTMFKQGEDMDYDGFIEVLERPDDDNALETATAQINALLETVRNKVEALTRNNARIKKAVEENTDRIKKLRDASYQMRDTYGSARPKRVSNDEYMEELRRKYEAENGAKTEEKQENKQETNYDEVFTHNLSEDN